MANGDKKRKPIARWRKAKPERWSSNRDQRELWRDGNRIATVDSCVGGWYWYVDGRNSLDERPPYLSQQEAMDAVKKLALRCPRFLEE